jgi:hypothetical protein
VVGERRILDIAAGVDLVLDHPKRQAGLDYRMHLLAPGLNRPVRSNQDPGATKLVRGLDQTVVLVLAELSVLLRQTQLVLAVLFCQMLLILITVDEQLERSTQQDHQHNLDEPLRRL